MLELQVSLDIISTVTEIPRGQEIWFKNFKFDMTPCKEFLKQEFINSDLKSLFLEVMSKNHMPICLPVYRSTLPVKGDIIRCIHIILNFCCVSQEGNLLI